MPDPQTSCDPDDLYADLADFVTRHRPHGLLAGDASEPTERGYLLTVACSCGVVFERWVTPEEAAHELSKNSEGRILVLSPPLRDVIDRRWHGRAPGCPFVFHVNGRRVGLWRKRWMTACREAGVPGRLFHDLRRTVVRNLVRSGVGERVAMAVTGHKTRSVFMRYDICDERDLREAANRLARYVNAHSEGASDGASG